MRSHPLPQLSTQQLHYLVTVVRSATWAAAADELGVTPSALSQGLAELERRIGVRLFRREGRGRTIDPGAAEVVTYAERVIAQTRDLGRWAAAARTGQTGTLRVGMIDLAAVHHYPSQLRAFRHARPEVRLQLAVRPTGELIAELLAGELELAVVVEPTEPVEGLHFEPLLRESLAVYAPPGVMSGVADGGPWVTFPRGSHTRALIERVLAEEGATFDVVAESHQPEVLREMVQLGMGWTVLPAVQAETEPLPLVRARESPIAERTLCLIRRSDALAHPASDALAELLIG